MINKIHYISDIATREELHVISITETWLTASCNSSFVQLAGYEFYRGDALGVVRKHGAGVYVSKLLQSVQVDIPLSNVVGVHLIELDLYVLSVYRPPSSTPEENSSLMEFLSSFSVGKEIVVLGDFNLPTIPWNRNNSFNTDYVRPVDRAFRDVFEECGLVQWVDFGTFFPAGSTLDLVFTSDEDRVIDVNALAPFPGCHHCPVVCRLVFQFEDSSSDSASSFCWERGNYAGMSD